MALHHIYEFILVKFTIPKVKNVHYIKDKKTEEYNSPDNKTMENDLDLFMSTL